MRYFLFKQNNSGNFYIKDKDFGINENIIIEAKNEDKADDIFFNIAKKYGYEKFNYSCECCGPRWDGEVEASFDFIELINFINERNRFKISIHTNSGEIINIKN
jgi:hypothetical protein